MRQVDFIVVGAGIAGASAAYELSKLGKVVVLEMERTAGYHTTGRSAAILSVNYVSPCIHILGRETKRFFENPPENFCDVPLTGTRRSLWVAREDQKAAYDVMLKEAQERNYNVGELGVEETMQLCPVLRRERVWGSLLERDSIDLDVNAIHQGFLKGFRGRGGELLLNAEVTAISKSGGSWQIRSSQGDFTAPIVINAAGAWCDKIAVMAGAQSIGLEPKLRTVFTFDAPADALPNSWPFTYDVEEKFYFKLEHGIILASAYDEIPSPPCDATPDFMDIAMAADRIQQSTTLDITHIRNKWAGLRTFAPDRELVVGEDTAQKGFYWVAGQGGIGLMTAPAVAETLVSLITKQTLPEYLLAEKISPTILSPSRFQR